MRTDWSTTSYSELATLAHCDEKWWQRYVLEEEVEQGKAAKLGDALHRATADVLTPNHKDLARATIDAIEALDATGKEQASYLLPRWWDVMRLVQPDLGVAIENEMELEAVLPSTGILFKGRLDTLHQNKDGLITLRECKSSGRKTNLDLITVSPQLTLYYWLLCENGIVPDRVLLDHINTYHYRSARHVSETAQLVWVDRNWEQIDQALEWAESLVIRRRQLIEQGVAIRNFGAHCSYCDHKLSCFEAMNFGRES